jgi:hypothetical protein
MKWTLKYDLPIISISCIIVSILISPFVKLGNLEFWQIVPVVVLIFNFNFLVVSFKKNIFFYIFYTYTLIAFFVTVLFNPEFFASIFLKQLLFTSSFCCFLLLLSYEDYFKLHYDRLISLLNVFLLIICIYGIYQCIGRVLHFPLTGDKFLRFRPFKIAGLYQISSFFEEPSFLVQFLICAFFIHVFFLSSKYKLILLLIVTNIILSISITGYLSLILLMISYIFFRLARDLINFKINRYYFLFVILFSILFVVFINSDFFSFIYNRFSSLLTLGKMVGGSGGKVDVSGNIRFFGEVETFKTVFNSDKFLFGFGLNYIDFFPDRKMTLNVFTEVILRWGLFGLFLFSIGFLWEFFSKNRLNLVIFFIFLGLYFNMDGAIARASFWTFIGLVFLFKRINSNQLILNT